MVESVLTRIGGTIKTTHKAAGNLAASYAVTVPTGKRWFVMSAMYQIATSATVGNRYFYARISDGTRYVWIGALSAVVVASKVAGYDINWGSNNNPSTTVRENIAGTAVTDVQVREACPLCWLKAGDSLEIVVQTVVDNADQIVGDLVYVEFDM